MDSTKKPKGDGAIFVLRWAESPKHNFSRLFLTFSLRNLGVLAPIVKFKKKTRKTRFETTPRRIKKRKRK
jgi:hypothetical protein